MQDRFPCLRPSLFTAIQHIYADNVEVIPPLTVAAIWYTVIVAALSVPQAWLGKRYGRGHGDGASAWAAPVRHAAPPPAHS